MPFKTTIAEPTPMTEDMEFEIEGLVHLGDNRFLLKDVKPIRIDFETIERSLSDSGMDKTDAITYTERFVDMILIGEMGKTFARRAKRIG